MTVVAIHQPEYLPWLGFVDKARRADVLALLDHVQFDRASLQHRARVAGPNGPFWLTVPYVHRHPQRIDELEFADRGWASRHWKSLQAAYGRAPLWRRAAPLLEAFFGAAYDRVVDATSASVALVLDAFEARPPRVVRTSALGVSHAKGELVLDVCRRLGASTYLAGRTGAAYLDAASFARAGIAIEVQRFDVPAYHRPTALTDVEARGLSAVDAWMHGYRLPALAGPAETAG